MKDFITILIIAVVLFWLGLTIGYICVRPKNWKTYVSAPFISAGIIISILVPFIGGSLLALLGFSKNYK